MTTGAGQPMRIRPRTRISLVVAGTTVLVAAAVAPLMRTPAARAYDGDYFDFCKNSLQQPDSVCCANSGGQMTNGVCGDTPAPPTPLPTITQQILPPVIGGPQ